MGLQLPLQHSIQMTKSHRLNRMIRKACRLVQLNCFCFHWRYDCSTLDISTSDRKKMLRIIFCCCDTFFFYFYRMSTLRLIMQHYLRNNKNWKRLRKHKSNHQIHLLLRILLVILHNVRLAWKQNVRKMMILNGRRLQFQVT